ncbi:hypothetical protein DFJ73DRAFT_6181 [Zopfochytrium polystomum]|nr:hypothetical protein DFJ73DRAFT_6181 [Zopfochytrium polystomum]
MMMSMIQQQQQQQQQLNLLQQQQQQSETSKSTLWMGDLEPWMDENFIKQLWYSLGENVTVKMIRDKATGACAGYCFVDFGTYASAARQLTQVQGQQIPGTNRIFKLNWASGGGLVDNRRDTGPEFSIFVGDLPQEVNDIILLNTFQSRYESTKSGKVVTDPMTGMSRGYGFVRFGSEIDQQRAMTEMQGQFCGSRPMRISVATPKNKMGANASAAIPGMAQMGTMPAGYGMGMTSMPMMTGMQAQMGGYYGMQMQMQAQAQALAQAQAQSQAAAAAMQQPLGVSLVNGAQTQSQIAAASGDPNNTTVFIGGLSSSVSESELRSHFGPFGEIIYSKIPPGKGCGFVQYSTRASAEMAIQHMNNALINGSRVRLSWGKSQAALKGPSAVIRSADPFAADPNDRINDSFINQKEESLEHFDVGGTGWRAQQVFAQ